MTSTEEILTHKFEQSRIVCWRDRKKELHDEFDALDLPGVEKIEVQNNEFAVLYRVLRAEPEKKFLIFIAGAEPPLEENWLLDLEVTYDNFLADQASLWLGELGLGYEFSELTEKNSKFFTSSKNRTALKKLLVPQETKDTIRRKMLAVTVGAYCQIDAILEELLEELAANKNAKFTNVQNFKLDDFLWREIQTHYGYQSQSPSIKDLVFRLFHGCYFMTIDPEYSASEKLNDEALVFLKRFKESVKHQTAYEKCSVLVAAKLKIEDDLSRRKVEMLGDMDFFKQIDVRILTVLVSRVQARTISVSDCSDIIHARRSTFWYSHLEHTYLAVDFASSFLHTLNETKIVVESLINAFNCYTQQYYQLDKLYRKFIFHAATSEQPSLLADLQSSVENFYSNRYLLKLSNLWQEKLDRLSKWHLPGIQMQTEFFTRNVLPFLERGKKVFVIISDALRYEVAEELCERLVAEDRYEPTLEAAYSTLPSFTALGMAALLPHKELAVRPVGKGIAVWADGMSTQGSDARAKVLATECKHSAVLSSKDLLAMTHETGRAWFRDNDVAYIYHNAIDKTGDDKMTESQTCTAAEKAIDEIIAMVKCLTGFNATNIIVTADHGFIYQNEELAADEFLGEAPSSSTLMKVNRRFVIGQNLKAVDGMKKFTPEELGFQSDCEIQIPKSINRLRVQGAGSRYVHGGATLQEIVIPVLKIRKKRKSDTSMVEVDIISGMTVITSGQLAITCYQRQPVGGKILPRKLTAGLFSQSDELISNEQEICFDLSATDPRDREITCSLVLTHNAEKYNEQEVVLKLRERESGTSYYVDYHTRKYQLRRQLMDMDF